tara:strand:- start:43201 stop:45900 length:2700 start_codon:yes stop_codon:yes gene_type:complete
MLKLKYLFLFYTSIFLLSGCGGSGGGGSIPSKQSLSCESNPEPMTSTICGTINAAANMQFDSDLNDINTPFIDNSSFIEAQKLQNFVTVQGFVTKSPTREFPSLSHDRSTDRFYNKTDEKDVFQVQLQKGQSIQLQVVNFETLEVSGEAFSGDIDLSLYNQTYDLIARSDSLDEFEYVQAPTTDIYYISVSAWTGASKYILQILPASIQNNVIQTKSTPNSMSFEPNQLIVQYTQDDVFKVANTEIKTLHDGISRPTLAFINEAEAFNISANATPTSSELASLNHLSYQKLLTLKKLKTLKQQSNVLNASLNYIREKQKTPSDSFYAYQWHYPSMNLPQAWDITTGTPDTGSIIVAVIDTGIYSAHPDLINKLVSGYDFIADDENSGDNESGIDNNPEDPGDGQDLGTSSWHGTHVAGTVAAQTDDNAGVAGVSWGAKIMPVRALGKAGGTSYDIMQAVRFAAGLENDSGTLPDQRADIINLSLGSYGFGSVEASLFKQVHDMGIMIVAAAGNDNTSAAFYPAAYDGVISVSATDFSKNKAPYSNFGSYIDIAAPGGNNAINLNGDGQPDGVLSTLVDDSSGTKKAVFGFYQGTSMAAPHISGMLALMKAVYPDLNANIVDSLLVDGSLSDDTGASGRDDIYGYGNANALKAVQAALKIANGGSLPPSPPILLASPSSLSFTNTAQATITLSNEGDGDPEVISASSNNYWLNVSPLNINDKGLGSYQVSINKLNLSDGFYLSSVIFTFDNAPSLSVRVSLNVGDIGSSGKLANVYTLLYDIENDMVIQSTQGINNNSESIQFSFTDVPQGRYEIVSGTDVDNDGYICQLGEACAIYPPTSQIDPIDNTDLETINVEMTAIILSTLNNISEQSARKPTQIAIKRALEPSSPITLDKKIQR